MRLGRRVELVVLREHDAKHECRRQATTIRFADSDVGNTPGSRLGHFARSKQITHEALAVRQKLRGPQCELDGLVQPGSVDGGRVDVIVAKDLVDHRHLAHEYRVHARRGENHRSERTHSEQEQVNERLLFDVFLLRRTSATLRPKSSERTQ